MIRIRKKNVNGTVCVCLSDIAKALGMRDGASVARSIANKVFHVSGERWQTLSFADEATIRELAVKTSRDYRRIQLQKLAELMRRTDGNIIFEDGFELEKGSAKEATKYSEPTPILAEPIKASEPAPVEVIKAPEPAPVEPARTPAETVDDQAVARRFMIASAPVPMPVGTQSIPSPSLVGKSPPIASETVVAKSVTSVGNSPPPATATTEVLGATQVAFGGKTPPREVGVVRSSLNPPATRQAMAEQLIGIRLAGIDELRLGGYRQANETLQWRINGDLLATAIELTSRGMPAVRYLVAVRFSPGGLGIEGHSLQEWSKEWKSSEHGAALSEDVRQLFQEIVDSFEDLADDPEKAELYQELAIAHLELMPGTQTVVIPNKDVANALGVAESTLRKHKERHPELLQGGTHWVVTESHTLGGTQDTLCWTKDGIILLVSELVQTLRARKFLRKVIAAGQEASAKAEAANAKAESANAKADSALNAVQMGFEQMLQFLQKKFPDTPPQPIIDVQPVVEDAKRALLKTAALQVEIASLLPQAKERRPEFLEERGIPDERTIRYTEEFSGDQVPDFCRYWGNPEKMVRKPQNDQSFAFPPGLAELVGNGRPDGDFILLWLAEHGFLVKAALSKEQTAHLDSTRNWTWVPTEKLTQLGREGKPHWFQWDAIVSRQFSAADQSVRVIRGAKWRFSPLLLNHLSGLWEEDRKTGFLLTVAANHRRSWFNKKGGRELLQKIDIASREELAGLASLFNTQPPKPQ